MRRLLLNSMALAVAAMLTTTSVCYAGTMTLDPIADTWLREAAPDGNYDADFISVWADGVEAGGERFGVLSFDLSGITAEIASASLELYLVGYARNNHGPCIQEAYLVSPVVTDDSTVTWNSYHGSSPVETQLEGLGVYDLPIDNTLDQIYSSTATAADVALLEAARTNGDGKIMFIFKTDEYSRDWADSESTYTGYGDPPASNPNMWPHLIIAEVPEPSTMLLLVVGMVSLVLIRRK